MKGFCAVLLLLAMLLSACANADAENGQSVSMPEKTKLTWPAELLPEGFPVAEYEEIYSVEQTGDAVKIILFADKGPSFTFPTVALFKEVLHEQGYRYCTPYTEEGFYINRDGYTVRIDTSSNLVCELAIINQLSPTGFTYSITVDKTDKDVEYLFLDYPAPDTDLGLTECVFDSWPSEYLPDNIPAPAPDAGITIERMEQRKNGVFITIRGSIEATGFYLLSVCQSGFVEVNNVSIGKDGDYFYVQDLVYPTSLDGDRVMRFQFCKYTEPS